LSRTYLAHHELESANIIIIMSKDAMAEQHLGLAGDSVSLEVAVLHAGERPEDARHHLLRSTLHTPQLTVTWGLTCLCFS